MFRMDPLDENIIRKALNGFRNNTAQHVPGGSIQTLKGMIEDEDVRIGR